MFSFASVALAMMSQIIGNVQADGHVAATDDPRCACLYRESGELPSDFIPADSAFANIKYYGTSCGLWDQLPGTPFFGSCDVSAGADLCTNSWCQGHWCYVDPSCPSAATTTPGWATGVSVSFSYAACGSTDCFTGTEGCPYDPEGACGKPSCACKYQNGEIPSEWYEGGSGLDYSMMPYYGTSCTAWDSMPSTPFYDSSCKGADVCEDSWCIERWCFVDANCPTAATVTNPFWANPNMEVKVHFSYETCGNPDCFMGSSECPYDDPRDSTTCGTTCGDLKSFYKENKCCKEPEKRVRKP